MNTHSKKTISASGIAELMICVIFLFGNIVMAAADGAMIFKQNCAVCHRTTEARLVGPGLKDVTKKRKTDWLKKWIHNSSDLIKTGDADAKAIFDEYQSQMPPFSLSDEETNAIIAYLDKPGDQAPQNVSAAVTTPVATEPIKHVRWVWNGATYTLVFCLLFVIGLTVYILNYANQVLRSTGRSLFQSQPTYNDGRNDNMAWLADNKITVTTIMILIVLTAILFAL